MGVILRVLVAVTIILTVSSPASAGPLAPDPVADDRYVLQLLDMPIADFIATIATGDGWFDVSNDGCSAPLVGNTGRSFNFTWACIRHDFGYRNLKLLDRRYSCAGRPMGTVCASAGSNGSYWNSSSRRRVDQRFLSDMRAHCRGRAWYDRPTCMAWAETYYKAVRLAGGP